jgi:hypothetical protein
VSFPYELVPVVWVRAEEPLIHEQHRDSSLMKVIFDGNESLLEVAQKPADVADDEDVEAPSLAAASMACQAGVSQADFQPVVPRLTSCHRRRARTGIKGSE